MASEVLMTISRDEIERTRLRSEEKYQLDMQSKLVTAKRRAEQKGLEKGLQKGEQKGEEKKLQEVLQLINQGLTSKEIEKHLLAQKA